MKIFESLVKLSNSWDADLAQKLALLYLESPCRAAELHEIGVSDSLTIWLHSQVTYDRGAWVDKKTGCRCAAVKDNHDYDLSLLTQQAENGLLHIASSDIAGGSPLWSLSTNDISRFICVLGHIRYGIGFSTSEKCLLSILMASDYRQWVAEDRTWGGHWEPKQRNYGAQALLSEIGLQAVTLDWLGRPEKSREHPRTKEMMVYSHKVVLPEALPTGLL